MLAGFAEFVFPVCLCFYICEHEQVSITACLSAFLCIKYFITITYGDCKMFLLAIDTGVLHVI